jgi:hypothetical protein
MTLSFIVFSTAEVTAGTYAGSGPAAGEPPDPGGDTAGADETDAEDPDPTAGVTDPDSGVDGGAVLDEIAELPEDEQPAANSSTIIDMDTVTDVERLTS